MKEYLEKILHQPIQIRQYDGMRKLPLSYRSSYSYQILDIGSVQALAAAPKEKLTLTEMRRQHCQIEVYTGMPCLLYLKDMTYYSSDQMVKEGIPFVWENHQIYLPFVGVLLDNGRRKVEVYKPEISFLAQRLLLTALYQGWEKITVTKASEALQVSKMSITRCFDEIEGRGIEYLKVYGRTRAFTADTDRKAMWGALRPILRNPVVSSFSLKETPDRLLPLAGTSALACYSMLDYDPSPILAVSKKEISSLNLTEDRLIPIGEDPGCTLQEQGYLIKFGDGKAVDPLTIVLSLSQEELADPRISKAVDEMLEEYVW